MNRKFKVGDRIRRVKNGMRFAPIGYEAVVLPAYAFLCRDGDKVVISERNWELVESGADSMKKWNGEGLPPVGAECEASHIDFMDGKFVEVKTLMMHENGIAMACYVKNIELDRNLYWFQRFRPIQSEREKVIEKACDVMVEHMRFESGLHQYCKDDALIRAMSALYDLGMLNLPK